MMETSARLLRLLSLLQSRRDWSGADLAERLEVTARTVRRDIDKLRTLGYPVHASTGVAGGYRRGAGAALPPLLLDDDEAVAVALGLRFSPTSAMVRLLDEDTCELRTGSNSLEAMAVYIGLLEYEMTVHEPPELVEVMHKLGERLSRATRSS